MFVSREWRELNTQVTLPKHSQILVQADTVCDVAFVMGFAVSVHVPSTTHCDTNIWYYCSWIVTYFLRVFANFEIGIPGQMFLTQIGASLGY